MKWSVQIDRWNAAGFTFSIIITVSRDIYLHLSGNRLIGDTHDENQTKTVTQSNVIV